MTAPLKDFRTALSEPTLAALEAEAAAFATDMQTISRQVLNEWAARRDHAYRVYARRVLANGMQTELPGLETGDDGRTRRRR